MSEKKIPWGPIGTIVSIAAILIAGIVAHVRLQAEVAQLRKDKDSLATDLTTAQQEINDLKSFDERLGDARDAADRQARDATQAARNAQLAADEATASATSAKTEAERLAAQLQSLTPESVKELVPVLLELQSKKEAEHLAKHLADFKTFYQSKAEPIEKKLGTIDKTLAALKASQLTIDYFEPNLKFAEDREDPVGKVYDKPIVATWATFVGNGDNLGHIRHIDVRAHNLGGSKYQVMLKQGGATPGIIGRFRVYVVLREG